MRANTDKLYRGALQPRRWASGPLLLLLAWLVFAASNLAASASAIQNAPPAARNFSQQNGWTENVRANTDNSGYGQHEPSLAVSRKDPNVIVIANKDYRDANIKRVWIEVSRDGGQTWPTQLHMPGLPPTVNESDPVVAARDDGRLYVACLTVNNMGLFITWSDDNGMTWQPSVAVVRDQEGVQDKPWMAIDNNPASPYYHRIYMAWAPGNIVTSYSADGGQTWSAPTHAPTDAGEPIEYPYLVVSPNGDAFLFYLSNWDISFPQPSVARVAESTDGGVTWGRPVAVSTVFQPPSPPTPNDKWRFFSILSAAADPTDNNRLYLAWTDYRKYNTDGINVMYSVSKDHGATWSPAARLSHDKAGVVRDHITPVLKVGQDGRLNALWLDRRLDPANRLFQAWYSASSDGGVTWEADTQVSDAPGAGFDLNVGFPPGSGNAAGDYWGLDTVGETVVAAWTDTRNNEQDIYTSRRVVQPVATGTTTPSVPTPTGIVPPPVPLPGTGSRLFPETQRATGGIFLEYWNAHGSLRQQGFPISSVIGEVSALDGKPYTVQYFERAVFEYHPEKQPPYSVLLSQLGTFRYREKYPNGAPGQVANNAQGYVLFAQTGKRLGGRFLEYWQRNGAVMQQGYPISDEFTEVSALDGKPYTVQYFERAVFEYHPEYAAPNDVLLSQLGTFRYREKYGGAAR